MKYQTAKEYLEKNQEVYQQIQTDLSNKEFDEDNIKIFDKYLDLENKPYLMLFNRLKKYGNTVIEFTLLINFKNFQIVDLLVFVEKDEINATNFLTNQLKEKMLKITYSNTEFLNQTIIDILANQFQIESADSFFGLYLYNQDFLNKTVKEFNKQVKQIFDTPINSQQVKFGFAKMSWNLTFKQDYASVWYLTEITATNNDTASNHQSTVDNLKNSFKTIFDYKYKNLEQGLKKLIESLNSITNCFDLKENQEEQTQYKWFFEIIKKS